MLPFVAWRDAHILDKSHRQWFASQIEAMHRGDPATSGMHRVPWATHVNTNTQSQDDGTSHGDTNAASDDPLAPLPGETDEQWQARHGFLYLTPGAVKIFDASRKFKEERDAQQAAEEQAEEEEFKDSEEEREDEIWHTSKQSLQAQPLESSTTNTLAESQAPKVSAPWQGKGTRAKKRKRREEAQAAARARAALEADSKKDEEGAPTRNELEELRRRALSAKKAKGS